MNKLGQKYSLLQSTSYQMIIRMAKTYKIFTRNRFFSITRLPKVLLIALSKFALETNVWWFSEI